MQTKAQYVFFQLSLCDLTFIPYTLKGLNFHSLEAKLLKLKTPCILSFPPKMMSFSGTS